jgi:hypothetical protein
VACSLLALKPIFWQTRRKSKNRFYSLGLGGGDFPA